MYLAIILEVCRVTSFVLLNFQPGIYLPFKFPGFRVLTSPELSVSQGVLVDQEMTLIDEKGKT